MWRQVNRFRLNRLPRHVGVWVKLDFLMRIHLKFVKPDQHWDVANDYDATGGNNSRSVDPSTNTSASRNPISCVHLHLISISRSLSLRHIRRNTKKRMKSPRQLKREKHFMRLRSEFNSSGENGKRNEPSERRNEVLENTFAEWIHRLI